MAKSTWSRVERLGAISERRTLNYKSAKSGEVSRNQAYERVLLRTVDRDAITPLDFGVFIRRRREALGLTIQDLEGLARGVSRSKIQRIEIGMDGPTADLIRLLWELGVDLGELCPIYGSGIEGGS